MCRRIAMATLIFSMGPFAFANQATSDPAAPSGFQAARGNAFNPDIGINTLFLYQNSNRGNDTLSDPQNGFGLQEAEIQFTSDVDAYSRFVALFSVHSELDTTSGTAVTEYHFEPEEVYAESISLPYVTLKGGKFKTAFGRHNVLHTHTYPFVDAPIIYQELLGEEGYNDTGVSTAFMIPLNWFSEITVQGLSGESDFFDNGSPNSTVGLANLTNLWELSEATTLQLGFSGIQGKNSFDQDTKVWGVDLTLKWRPLVLGTETSASWSSEFISRELDRGSTIQRASGFVSYLQHQLARRWWVLGRGEYLQIEDTDPLEDDHLVMQKQSLLVAFVPSEFSSFRLQCDQLRDDLKNPEYNFMLQMNFSIGAHSAHLY